MRPIYKLIKDSFIEFFSHPSSYIISLIDIASFIIVVFLCHSKLSQSDYLLAIGDKETIFDASFIEGLAFFIVLLISSLICFTFQQSSISSTLSDKNNLIFILSKPYDRITIYMSKMITAILFSFVFTIIGLFVILIDYYLYPHNISYVKTSVKNCYSSHAYEYVLFFFFISITSSIIGVFYSIFFKKSIFLVLIILGYSGLLLFLSFYTMVNWIFWNPNSWNLITNNLKCNTFEIWKSHVLVYFPSIFCVLICAICFGLGAYMFKKTNFQI